MHLRVRDCDKAHSSQIHFSYVQQRVAPRILVGHSCAVTKAYPPKGGDAKLPV
jgi:hypothetical protein